MQEEEQPEESSQQGGEAASPGAAQATGQAPAAPALVVARLPALPRLWTRRSFVRAGFWGGAALSLGGSAYALWNLMWPRHVAGFGTIIKVPAAKVPKPGEDPIYFIEGRFYLVNLEPQEGAHGAFGKPGEGGLLALYQKCPHLGCRVPWNPTFVFDGVPRWYRCPCHGSTFTKAGIRVFGPAPRPMDTMQVEVDAQGNVLVRTGEITLGGEDNPQRAMAYTAAAVRALRHPSREGLGRGA